MASMNASIVGGGKLQRVQAIIRQLEGDTANGNLSNDQRKSILEELKVYGRDARDSDPIYTKEGIKVLTQQAFAPDASVLVTREALSCLANALFLKEETRDILADLNIIDPILARLKTSSSHDEFLLCRILFLLTYVKERIDWEPILKEQGLANVINDKIRHHSERYTSSSPPTANPMDDNALKETATLLFNIAHLNAHLAPLFASSLPYLVSIISASKANQPVTQPLSSVLNTLLSVPDTVPEWAEVIYPSSNPTALTSKILLVLTTTLKSLPEQALEGQATPIITLIHKIYTTAPSPVKVDLKSQLLPSDADRSEVLGRGSSLSATLLRLTMSPATPQLSDAIGNLIFEICEHDAEKFVSAVGFGIASGYLVNHGIPLPAGPGAESASGTDVNPITGQRRDMESVADLPEMTDEEKEREAERLFVLFERLNATGVMNVENPVRRMAREGQLEELPDDTPVDEDENVHEKKK